MSKWLLLASLFALLALAGWIAWQQWIATDIDMPPWAWAVIGAGILVVMLVGVGLMSLIFYSSRMGYDEPPHQVPTDDDHHQ
jgi:hypothetical protein